MLRAFARTKLKANSNSEFVNYLNQQFGHKEGYICLMGEWGLDSNQRCAILFLDPVFKIEAELSKSSITTPAGEYARFAACLEPLEHFLLGFQSEQDFPFLAGALNYELLHAIEDVRTAYHPDSAYTLFGYRQILIIPLDNESEIERILIEYSEFNQPFWTVSTQALEAGLKINSKQPELLLPQISLTEALRELASYSNFSKSAYECAVLEIIEMISRGELYQVNLSQCFKLPFSGSEVLLWRALCLITAARYAAFARLPRGQQLISSSPELFLECQDGRLRSSPIKGTVPSAQIAELRSEKNLAELAMIVDLIRNDMGRIARTNSVKVEAHARVDSLPYVHHLVSDISCEIEQNSGFARIIRALFPCGSISGAPKIAAMKAISRIEAAPRGVYTGAIGYLTSRHNFKFNVAIRTLSILNNELRFSAGGGVVYDSNPEAEYLETLSKALPIYRAWKFCS